MPRLIGVQIARKQTSGEDLCSTAWLPIVPVNVLANLLFAGCDVRFGLAHRTIQARTRHSSPRETETTMKFGAGLRARSIDMVKVARKKAGQRHQDMQTPKAVIYARVSSREREREGFSIPAQLELPPRTRHGKRLCRSWRICRCRNRQTKWPHKLRRDDPLPSQAQDCRDGFGGKDRSPSRVPKVSATGHDPVV